jgi:SAM-dependent methyltransferase
MHVKRLFLTYYGDQKRDGTLIFYDWIRQHVGPQTQLLNLGAGPPTRQKTRILKGEVECIVGADIDPVIFENDELDEAALIVDGRLPFPDNAFDCVISDYVLEHVDKPWVFLSEVNRVMKPGARFFFRTPNIYHYVPLVSMATPHRFHQLVANRLRGLSEETHEPWETYYRMNSRRRLRALARKTGFHAMELRTIESEPSYLMFHPIPFYLGMAYERLVNSTELLAGFRVNILGLFQKAKD